MANRHTCGPLLIWSRTMKHEGPPSGMGFVASRATFKPVSISSPALPLRAPPPPPPGSRGDVDTISLVGPYGFHPLL